MDLHGILALNHSLLPFLFAFCHPISQETILLHVSKFPVFEAVDIGPLASNSPSASCLMQFKRPLISFEEKNPTFDVGSTRRTLPERFDVSVPSHTMAGSEGRGLV
jgi:hypothetical protein